MNGEIMLIVRATLIWMMCVVTAFGDERAQERTNLFNDLRTAPNEAIGRAAEERIWRFWVTGPSEDATALVAKAMERRRWYDFAGALKLLDDAVKIAPEWAEAWNQRAFIHFLRESYEKSLEDLDKALEREPMHFAAMSGKARIFMRQGRIELGQRVLRQAVKIHPWLRERDLLLASPEKKL